MFSACLHEDAPRRRNHAERPAVTRESVKGEAHQEVERNQRFASADVVRIDWQWSRVEQVRSHSLRHGLQPVATRQSPRTNGGFSFASCLAARLGALECERAEVRLPQQDKAFLQIGGGGV